MPIKSTWQLYVKCWQILIHHKRALIFPISIALSEMIFFTMIFGAILFFSGYFEWKQLIHVEHNLMHHWSYFFALIIFYMFFHIALTFFNAAAFFFFQDVFNFKSASLIRSIKLGFKHFQWIVFFALMNASWNVIFNLLERPQNWLGHIMRRKLGFNWYLISVFLFPVMMVESLTLKQATKRSYDLIAHHWGEQVFFRKSFGIIYFLLILPAIIAATGLGFLPAFEYKWIGLLVIFIYIAVLLFVNPILNAVLQMAVLKYLDSGEVPEGLNRNLLDDYIY